jgi:hypothetical protein
LRLVEVQVLRFAQDDKVCGEGIEQRAIPRLGRGCELFRMPLSADHPPVVGGPLRAFDDSVGRMRNGSESLTQPGDGLMVHRVDLQDLRAERDGEPRSRLDADLMYAPVARTAAVVLEGIRPLTRDVLYERAAQGDVGDLDAAADRQGGKAPFARRPHQRQFEGVALGVDFAQCGVGSSIEVPGIDVFTAGEHEPLHAFQHRVRIAGIEDWKNERPQPDRTDGIGVCSVGAHTHHAADRFRGGGDGDGRKTRHWTSGCEGESGFCILSVGVRPLQRPALPPHVASSRNGMFESFRQSLSDLMDRATPPEERRVGLARMKETLVQAKMGLEDLRRGVVVTRQRLDAETRELETMRRRKSAATGINDAETVALAEKYEAIHAERAEIVRRKLAAQEEELALVEREVSEMTVEFKNAVSGAGVSTGSASVDARARAEADSILDGGASVRDEIDALGRAGARSAREAEAERQLAELKRRMGK